MKESHRDTAFHERLAHMHNDNSVQDQQWEARELEAEDAYVVRRAMWIEHVNTLQRVLGVRIEPPNRFDKNDVLMQRPPFIRDGIEVNHLWSGDEESQPGYPVADYRRVVSKINDHILLPWHRSDWPTTDEAVRDLRGHPRRRTWPPVTMNTPWLPTDG